MKLSVVNLAVARWVYTLNIGSLYLPRVAYCNSFGKKLNFSLGKFGFYGQA